MAAKKRVGMASHPFRTNPVSGKSLSARPAPKGREPGPGAASRTNRLAGGEFHQLDGVRIDNRAAHPLGCIEMHEGLVPERIAQDARLAAIGAPAGTRHVQGKSV